MFLGGVGLVSWPLSVAVATTAGEMRPYNPTRQDKVVTRLLLSWMESLLPVARKGNNIASFGHTATFLFVFSSSFLNQAIAPPLLVSIKIIPRKETASYSGPSTPDSGLHKGHSATVPKSGKDLVCCLVLNRKPQFPLHHRIRTG
jgi:hypothetical protein